jgi:hypothetical protein
MVAVAAALEARFRIMAWALLFVYDSELGMVLGIFGLWMLVVLSGGVY